MRIVSFVILGAILGPGCGRSETDEPPPAKAAIEEAPQTASTACAALGQAFCERTSVPCETSKTMFERAQLAEADCAEGRRALEDLDNMPPDTRGRAQVALLEYVMRKSPVIDQQALTELAARVQPD
jgi:hypothetical protein